ncbi:MULTISPECIES: hypothetical protein [unclassified Rathayibacter]|jgi:hypothetical protein|uniref:hypothetical protein n=1 Tax=unclassified Rathayibacter TaxID=2609250 RepID=UPI000CE7D34D|nr:MULTISPECIES: hypothetical protein [unclassified Rathayibacter]PPF26275.1 hypothetical protein C5C54_13560 [Rathayibacter sp. AY1F2]PPH42258.1 hypothetical protein C5C42_15425 [Rathayibacter sp. AY1F7]
MADDDGGVEESINSSARIALTIAIQLGEKLARAYQDAMREAQQRSAIEARALAARYEGERASARQAVSIVHDSQWWDQASVRDVARVAETAAAWKDADPQIASVSALIASEAKERYGVDVATLQGIARDTPTELDLAKHWATTAAPEGYHRHDEDRLAMTVGNAREPSPAAERALVADYRAAVAGDIPALELSVAEEWKRANDPVGYQDYRVETAVAFDDNGRVQPADPAVAEAARAALVQEWRTEQAGGSAVVPDAERAQSKRDVTEAQIMIAEADRLDRANDASAQVAPTEIPIDAGRRADELEQQAAQYDRDAEAGGTLTQSSDELRSLAEDARAQVALYRDDRDGRSAADSVPVVSGEGRSASARSDGELAYDSAERRAHTAAAMQAQGVPQEQVDALMTMDASFASSARGAAPAGRTRVPSTRGGRGQGRQIERSEHGR